MCPMSPRLLRPRATNVNIATDADARAYIDAVRAADGQYMEGGVQRAIDAFIIGCKADSIWTPIKACCILMGARTLSGALTPLVGAAPTNNGPFVSGDYNRKTGLVGDGTNKYLDSNRNNNADPQNDVHHALYVSNMAAAGASAQSLMGFGGNATGSTSFTRVAAPGGTVFTRNRSAAADPTTASGLSASTGFWGNVRTSSSQFSVRQDGAGVTYQRTSESPGSQDVFIFARSSSTGTLELPAPHRVAFYSIGENLSLSLLDTRVTNLYNAIGAAI
jgi:hypothetical protein